jgi:hypothetical protein
VPDYVYSDWIEFEEPEGYFIVGGGASLGDYETNPAFPSGLPAWAEGIIRNAQSRRGSYTAQQVADGDPVYGALSCVIAHANVGHQGHQSWNTDGGGAENTPGVCQSVPTGGDAETESSTATTTVRIAHEGEHSLPISNNAGATMGGPAYALFPSVAQAGMEWYGALEGGEAFDTAIDPTTYGFPAGAELIPEGDEPDLLGIDLADGDPVASTTDFANQWALNDGVAPVWDADDEVSGPWLMGPVALPPLDDDPLHTFVEFLYSDEAGLVGSRWTEVPHTDLGWGNGISDGDVVIAWPSGYPTSIDENTEYDEDRPASIAIRFRTRARRFRFRWEATTPGHRRVIGRPHPARVWGDNTVQNGRRVIGGIL